MYMYTYYIRNYLFIEKFKCINGVSSRKKPVSRDIRLKHFLRMVISQILLESISKTNLIWHLLKSIYSKLSPDRGHQVPDGDKV